MTVVRVGKQTLQTLLEKAVSVVPSKHTQVTTSNFFLQATEHTLTVTATDTSLWISALTYESRSDGDIEVSFPASKLLEIAKEAPDGDIHLHIQDQVADIFADRCNWRLALGNPLEYPRMPDLIGIPLHKVPRKVFTDGIATTRHAAGRDGVRQHCMMIDVRNSRMTATDGSGRLQQVTLDPWPTELQLQIPISATDDLVKLLGASGEDDIEIGENENFLIFVAGYSTFVTRKSVHQFPDVEALTVAPALMNANHALACDTKALLKAVRRARINANQETSDITLEMSERTLTVRASDTKGNSAAETIDCRWNGAEGRVVTVNHRYLTDLLRPISGIVVMKLGPDSARALSPALLQDVGNSVLGLAFQMRSY